MNSIRYRQVMERLTIRSESGAFVPLRFSQSQEILWTHISTALDDPLRKNWFIVLKGRQVYATTLFEALVFTRTAGRPGTHSLIVAQDLDSTHEIFNMAKRFYEAFPLPKLKPSKVTEIEFPFPQGTSRFRVASAGKSSKGRGTTQSCLHLTEVAFWPYPEVMTGLAQSIPDLPDTIWVIESTANGMTGIGQPFYLEWKRAVDALSDFTPIFIPWYVMPKYRATPELDPDKFDEEETILFNQFKLDGQQLAWRRKAIETKCSGSLDIFHAEYPVSPEEAFVSTGSPAFSHLSLMKQRQHVTPPLLVGYPTGTLPRKAPKGPLWVWETPERGRDYVIGVDTSEGMEGGDYACAQVLDMLTLRQVARLHGVIPPFDFAEMVAQLGAYYNKALVAVEVNNVGYAVQDYLIRTHHYPRLHPWKGTPDKILPKEARVWGWQTNVATRPLLLTTGREYINKGHVTIREEALLEELTHFSKNERGKFEAEAGFHDDRVMAFLIACQSREENWFGVRLAPPTQEPEIHGIRFQKQVEPRSKGAARLDRILKDRAKRAVGSWMQY